MPKGAQSGGGGCDFEETPFDSLADRGQYRAFQRAYGKENQAMLTLIVLTVAWSYAAHVYGHGTVFVWFTRTVLAVLLCFLCFNALKYVHGSLEQQLIRRAAARTPVERAAESEKKQRPKRPKHKPKPQGVDTARQPDSAAQPSVDSTLTEPAPAPQPASAPKPAKSPAGATPTPKLPKRHKAPKPTPQTVEPEITPQTVKPEAELAAETALAQARSEAQEAAKRLEAATQAIAVAQATPAIPQPKPKPKPKPQPQLVSTPTVLPAPRSVAGATEQEEAPPESPTGSYVPPHLRSGYKSKGHKQPRAQPRQRGRQGSDKQKKEQASSAEPAAPKG